MAAKRLLWSVAIAAVAAGVWHTTASASAGPDLLVQLTSGPLTAHSGQRVTHTVEVAAAQASGEVRSQMTFSTTVPLDGAAVTTTSGTCQVVSPVSVTCQINGAVDVDSPVVVTITGQIPPAAAAGHVVYNVASVVTEASDPDMSNNTSSNAYVLAAAAGDPAGNDAEWVQREPAEVKHTATASGDSWAPALVVGVITAGAVQAIVLLLARRRRPVTPARHARPTGYRPRHAKSWWRTFMDTELRRWGRGPARRHRRPAHLTQLPGNWAQVGIPAAALVLVAFLALSTLPALAVPGQSGSGPAPTGVTRPSQKPAKEKPAKEDSKDDKSKDDKKPKPAKTKKPKEPKEPKEPNEEPLAEPEPVPVLSAPAEPSQAPAPAAPAPAAPAPAAPAPGAQLPSTWEPLPEPEQADPPTTDHAKTLSALHKALRRGEYLRQMATCTSADLDTARARVGRIDEQVRAGRVAERVLEDARGMAAVLQMALDATNEELQRVEARAAALSEQTAQWAKEAAREPSGRLAKVVDGRVSSPFGNRFDPYYQRWQLHSGVDIAAGYGVPIRAAAAGVVKQAGWNGGYGNHTCIEHGQVRGERLTTCYAHQSEITVAAGQSVKPGEVIGKVGNTGASTGPHLHFEVRLGGRAVDPAPWWEGAA